MQENNTLLFTDRAAKKAKELIIEENNNALKLRVFITGGGCAGFQYGFTFDELISEDDSVIDKNGVSLIVDSMSYQYLVGGSIDYVEGLEGSRFIVDNPNADSTCGCGSSFSI
jgi:iron-sulfur cluster insertion protein